MAGWFRFWCSTRLLKCLKSTSSTDEIRVVDSHPVSHTEALSTIGHTLRSDYVRGLYPNRRSCPSHLTDGLGLLVVLECTEYKLRPVERMGGIALWQTFIYPGI